MSKKLEMVLNINSGVVCPRTPATDENPVIFKRIDFETGKAINDKKVSANAVIEALEKQERSAPDFNWREYDKKRRAAEKLLNVSKREMTPVNEDPYADEGKTGEEVKEVSLKELGLSTRGGARESGQGERESGQTDAAPVKATSKAKAKVEETKPAAVLNY